MFYVYVHRRATDQSVFYVGKGVSGRAYETHKSKRSLHWVRTYEKHGRTVEIVQSGLTEYDALALEISLIAHYGIENLCNHSTGGESGGSGRTWSEESRKKLSDSKKGKKQPWAGRSLTEAGRQRIIESKTGKPAIWLYGEKNPMKDIGVAKKMAEAQRGQKRPTVTGAKNGSARSVICIETGAHFATMKDAGLWVVSIGKSKNSRTSTNINSVCLGLLKRAYGYTWKYAEKLIPA